MIEERKQCDVLCVGGGVAGMMAAIRASEKGARVIVAEKSNTMRSGGGGMGVDHFFSYIPEYHGDFNVFMKELTIGQRMADLSARSVSAQEKTKSLSLKQRRSS